MAINNSILNSEILVTGDAYTKNVGTNAFNLVYNVSGATGSPNLVLSLTETDPANPTVPIGGGQTANTGTISGSASGEITVTGVISTCVLATWTISGGTFTHASLTVTQANPVAGGGGTVNQGGAAALAGAWPVEITDGSNVLGTNANPLAITGAISATNPSVSVISSPIPLDATTIGGSNGGTLTPVSVDAGGNVNVNVQSGLGNPSVAENTGGAPTYSTEIGYIDGSGYLQGVSPSTPLPITGSISATNPSVSTLATPIPADATLIGGSDGTNLQAISTDASGNVNVNVLSGGGSNPSVGSTGVTAPSSATEIGILDVSSNLVGVSASNPLPITGSISATNPSVSTPGTAVPADATMIGGTDGTDLRAISTDASGNVNVNVISGGGSNPSVGTNASTTPNSSTLIGASDGTDLIQLLVETSTHPNLRIGLFDGATEATVKAASTAATTTDTAVVVAVSPNNSVSVTGAFYQTTQPVSGSVTVTQTTSSNLNANVSLQATGALSHNLNQDGSGNLGVNIENSPAVTITSGSVTVVQTTSSNLNANVSLQATGALSHNLNQDGSGNVGVNVENSPAVTITSGSVTVVQTTSSNLNANVSLQATGALSHNLNQDGSGNLGVNIENSPAVTITSGSVSVSGSVTANAGTNLNTSLLALDSSVNGILNAQGSTTSGESGPLIQGAVTTSAPTYSTGKTSPLSLDTAGNLRVNVTTGGGSNASVGADGVTAPTSATEIGMIDAGGLLQGVSATNPLPITGSISASNPSVGTNTSSAPSSSTEIGYVDGSSKLQGVSTSTPLPVTAVGSDTSPSGWNTTTPLAANGTFTGSWVNCTGYADLQMIIYADQISAINGVVVNFSPDGTNVDDAETWTYAPTAGSDGWSTPIRAKYVQVTYTNGTTIQGAFRLSAVLKVMPSFGTVIDLSQAITTGAHAETTRSLGFGRISGGNSYFAEHTVKLNNIPAAAGDTALVVAPSPNTIAPVAFGNPGTADIFGQLVVVSRLAQIQIPFFQSSPTSLLTITTANGGSATQGTGVGVFSCGNSASGQVTGVTANVVNYSPHCELFAAFTASFTTGVTSSYQRIGLYNATDGFSFGYNGTVFGIWTRYNGADTWIPQSSWNTDTLTGVYGSKFTSAGTIVSLIPTYINLYRIRFGWLGIANIIFEVLAPDGNFVIVHILRAPNAQTTVTVTNPNMPLTVDILNTAGGNILTVSSGCWVAGTSAPETPNIIGSGTISSNGQYVQIPTTGMNGLAFTLSGTWAGTLNFQFSIDGIHWLNDSPYVPSNGTFAQGATGNNDYTTSIGGYKQYRIVAVAWTSGSAIVTFSTGPGTSLQVTKTLISDGANNGPAAVKAANTSALSSDPSLVVALSPSSNTVGFNQNSPLPGEFPGVLQEMLQELRRQTTLLRFMMGLLDTHQAVPDNDSLDAIILKDT